MSEGDGPTGPLTGVRAELATIYETCMAVGVHPREADEMEIWEVAVVFGLHRPPETPDETGGVNLIQARMLHAQDPERYPLPEPTAADVSVLTEALA